MKEQVKQIISLLEDIIYNFSAHDMGDNCCENISHGEFRALRVISRMKRCTMQDIAKNIAVTKSGATRIISRLREKKLARRITDKNDGRVCCVQLSKNGKSLISKLAEKSAGKMATILSAMKPDMRQILLIGLKTFVETSHNKNINNNTLKKSSKKSLKTYK